MAGLLQDHWWGAEWSGSPSGHVSVVEDVEPGEGGVHVSVEVGGATELRQPDAVTAGQLQNGDVGRRGPRHAFRPDGRHHLAVLQQHHRRLQYITHRPAAKALVTRATRLQLDCDSTALCDDSTTYDEKLTGCIHRKKVELQSIRIEFYNRMRRLTYFGHCTSMDSNRYPHILLYGHIDGARSRGRPRKRWLDNVKEDCATLQLTLFDADRLAKNRSGWRSLIHRTCAVRAA